MTTTTVAEANPIKRYCNICKASKGHYTHQHEMWAEIPE